MTDTVLLTKVRIPPVRADRIPRPHLIARLDEALHRRVTLLCAPAGYGKSTALAGWIRDRGVRAAWLSVDPGDNDLSRFSTYLCAALEEARTGVTVAVPSPSPGRRSLWQTQVLAALVNQLAGLPGDLLLVLDDYHQIGAQPVHEAVAFLAERLPPQVHLCLSARIDPPLPLARLRARGELLELRAPDLRFSEPEVGRFLEQVTGGPIPAECATTLAARTEGWPAAVQLAGLSLRGRSPREMLRVVRAFSGEHPHVADLLTGEVLEQQPESVRRFLMATAVLERMSAPLCAALMGDDPCRAARWQRQLEALEQANLFLIPLDEERVWYRYHHLFADLLRRRIRQEEPELVPQLHRRAARWYAARGMLADAIPHAFQAEDAALAEALVRQAALPALLRGQTATLYRWLSRLGAARVAASPTLALLMAWTHLAQGEIDAAGRWLGDLPEAGLSRDWLPLLHLAQAVVCWLQGNPACAQTYTQRVMLALESLEEPAPGAHQASGEGAHGEEGARRFATALRLLTATVLGETLKIGGKVREATAVFQQGLAAVQGFDLEPDWAALVANLEEKLALLLYEQNDLPGAERHAERGLALAAQTRNALFEAGAHGVLALTRQARGKAEEAQAEIERARAIASAHRLPHEQAYYEAAQVRLWIAGGQREGPEAWLMRQPPALGGQMPLDGAPAVVREYVAATRVRTLLAVGHPDQALAEARALGAQAEAAGQAGVWLEATVLEALALSRLNRAGAARDLLARALEAAAAGGHVRTFLDLGPPMAALLQDFLSRGSDGGEAALWVRRLLEASPVRSTHSLSEVGPGGSAALVEPLSAREEEVLMLLAQGLRNREIAQRLVVTVGTVKRHVSNICGKIGAQSRTQAVIRAQELGLLRSVPQRDEGGGRSGGSF